MLPTFIVIGAMKCGTTSLYYYLDAHPDVAMSIQKETDFFIQGRNYEKRRDWYESRFQEEAVARGECSTNYTKAHLFPGVVQRMHELVPEVQLVYMVRDPVRRMISHYVQNRVQEDENRSFAEAVTTCATNKYVMTSRYYWQLQPYLETFGDEQILVRSLESLRDDPARVLGDIQSFIGVQSRVTDRQLRQGRFNARSEKKIRGEWYRWLSGLLNQPIKDTLRPYVPLQWLPGASVDPPDPSEELRDRLREAFREDVESLRQLTGRSFDRWSV